MRKELLLFFLLCSSLSSFAQAAPNFKQIKLNKRAHYKDAEQTVINTINYLFATPIDEKNKARADAGQFLLKWMNGTPDYTFHLGEKETNYFNTDADLMLIYMAALTKFTLANKNIKEQKTLILGTMNIVLPYLNNQAFKKTWSVDLWQLTEAHQKGRLESFLYPSDH